MKNMCSYLTPDSIPGVSRGWCHRRGAMAKPEELFAFRHPGAFEVVAAKADHMAAATAAALCATVKPQKPLIWISSYHQRREYGAAFGPGLLPLGIAPERILYLHARNGREALWCAEEALQLGDGAAILAELEPQAVDFTATRRLQMASARLGRTITLLFPPGREGATAAEARWEVMSQPASEGVAGRRSLGAPRWQVVLHRSRSQPGAVHTRLELSYDHQADRLSVVSPLGTGTSGRSTHPTGHTQDWHRAS